MSRALKFPEVNTTVSGWDQRVKCFVQHAAVVVPEELSSPVAPTCPEEMQQEHMWPEERLREIAEACLQQVDLLERTTHLLVGWPDFLFEILPNGTVGRCSLDVEWRQHRQQLVSELLR